MAIPRAIVGPTTRFRSGVTNVPVGVTMGNYIALDPTRVHEFFDDFDSNPDIVATTPNGWTVTTSNSGAITTKIGGAGGRVNLATGSTSTNSTEAQLNSASFVFDSTKRMFIKFLIQADVVATTDICVGLQVSNTTPLATNRQGIYYIKATGAATGKVYVSNGTTTTTSAVLNTMAAAVDVSIGIAYDPYGKDDSGNLGCIKLFVNDVQQPQKLSIANAPTGNLTPTMFIETHTALAVNLQVDYLLASLERFEPSVL